MLLNGYFVLVVLAIYVWYCKKIWKVKIFQVFGQHIYIYPLARVMFLYSRHFYYVFLLICGFNFLCISENSFNFDEIFISLFIFIHLLIYLFIHFYWSIHYLLAFLLTDLLTYMLAWLLACLLTHLLRYLLTYLLIIYLLTLSYDFTIVLIIYLFWFHLTIFIYIFFAQYCLHGPVSNKSIV